MTKKLYILFIILLFALMVIVELSAPKQIDWTPTFSQNDKIPFGAYVLNNTLTDVFPDRKIMESSKSVYETLNSVENNDFCYFYTGIAEIDHYSVFKLFKRVKQGASAFISSNYFGDYLFTDSLNVRINVHFVMEKITPEKIQYDTASLNFYNPALASKTSYDFARGSFQWYFSKFDTTNTTALGFFGLDKINFIKVKYGKGEFFLHLSPYSFTNYHILNEKNGEYTYKCLSYIDSPVIIRDAYYNEKFGESQSPLRFFLSQDSLRNMIYLITILLLIALVFNVKRRQAAIPIIRPLSNMTLDFVRTLANLYFSNKNHGLTAKKKIDHFLGFVRRKLFVNTTNLNPDTANIISLKSGFPVQDIIRIFTTQSKIDKGIEIKIDELKDLNETINKFYKKVNYG